MAAVLNVASYLKPYIGDKESVTVKGSTVRECLADLIRKHPGVKKMVFNPEGNLHDYVSVFVGGDIAYADQLDKPVKEGETLHLLYIIGGG